MQSLAARRGVYPIDQAKWRDAAACKGVGPAVFFQTSPRAAKLSCRRCAVQEICFWYALATEEDTGYRFGVWGAKTPGLRGEIASLVGPGYARLRLGVLVGTHADALDKGACE